MAVTGLMLRRLRHRAHGGQPPDVRRAREDQRVRARSCSSLGRAAVDRARRAARRRRAARGRRRISSTRRKRAARRSATRSASRRSRRSRRARCGGAACCSWSSSSSTSCTSRRARIHPDVRPRRDVYGNVVAGFRISWVALFYLVAMVALGSTCIHGAWSRCARSGLTQAVARHRCTGACRTRASPWSSVGSASPSFPIAVLSAIAERSRSLTHRRHGTASRSRPVRSSEKWDKHRFEMKLVNPANKRKYTVIVVGTGLAGGAAAATLSELGYNVSASASRTRRAARTRSPRRAASTPRRTTRTTATASTACSTTRSRAATSARARPTCTGSRRSA